MSKKAVVIGATGDVGRGLVKALLSKGYNVLAVGRDRSRLAGLEADFDYNPALTSLVGSIADDDQANETARNILKTGSPEVVIVSVNGTAVVRPVFELETEELAMVFGHNVLPHLAAAKALVPIVAKDGVYLGIGGGMADLTFPGMAAISVAQAAQRAFFRYLASDPLCAQVNVRELMLYSMIAGKSSAKKAESHWITAEEVGQHVLAILADLAAFEGPILTVKSRKQIGLPERKPD